ncbi:hypothetical protein BDN71DRAFT_1507941 [Pleurotus eryngii]|uniref:Uncharacterized protein n=1 Tax=Pleurotus eryngii TaxID=5323 RepID=A0A9P5ZTL4_PLEER|nr:hypothetical protein BDN71DRAFT_1507941 [Pleurotus eryngii]
MSHSLVHLLHPGNAPSSLTEHLYDINQITSDLLGLATSSPLYTISIYQVVLYFRTYRLDPYYLKCTVLVLIFMDSARFVFLAHTVYTSFITLNDVLHHVDRQVTCHENLMRQITLMTVEFLGVRSSDTLDSSYAYLNRSLRQKTSLCCCICNEDLPFNRNKLLVGMIAVLNEAYSIRSGTAAIAGFILSVIALTVFAAQETQPQVPIIHFMIANVYVNSFLASLNWRTGLREVGQGSDLLSTQASSVQGKSHYLDRGNPEL